MLKIQSQDKINKIKTIANPLVVSICGAQLNEDPKDNQLNELEKKFYQQKYDTECTSKQDALIFKNYLKELEHKLISHPAIGGIILFSRNYKSKKQLTALATNIKKIAKVAGKDNFLVYVDQEGGLIQRFENEFTPIPSALTFGKMYDKDPEKALSESFKYGYIMAKELKECNVDISLAPCCDLDLGNKVISQKERAFHKNPKIATKLISAFIDGMKKAKMPATAKHFPGHGMGGIGDSHKVQPIDNRAFTNLNKNDLLVFKNLIAMNKIDLIMPSHIIYPDVDPNFTAGTSKIWLENILRAELQFKGSIISDCLSMKGALGNNYLEKILKSLTYGNIGLFCNQPPWVFLEVANKLNDYIEKNIHKPNL